MDAYYNAGFAVGAVAYFAVLAAIYWFVGRFGWIGVAVRAVVVILAILRVLALLRLAGTA